MPNQKANRSAVGLLVLFMETIAYGSQGAYVEALQLALYRAGFLTQQSEIDGIFEINTQNAVLRFQRAYGVVPDGIVGVKTWNQLIPFLTGYTTHTIASGDTFYKIAKQYGSTAAAIAIAGEQCKHGREHEKEK